MVYIDLTIVLTVILCVVIFGTGNVGLYITFRGNNINVITYRSSFVVFLGYYYILNYPRLLYMILSFFVYNSDFAQWYIIYTQCIYIIQSGFVLFMALSRLFAMFKSKFDFSSLAFTNMLAVLMFFLVGLYALAAYVFKVRDISVLVNLVLIVANIASTILSLIVILCICCVRNSEKRQQVKLAIISFFMAGIYLIECAVEIIISNTSRNSFPVTSYSYNNGYSYYNTNFYSFVNSMGYITIAGEIITLLGSCILYFLFRPHQSTRPQLSTAVMQGNGTVSTPPVGPLMT